MRHLIISILIIVGCSAVANADISCKTNSIGVTTCTDNDTGTRIRGRAGTTGQTKYTTNKGQTIRSRTSPIGVTTYASSDGTRTKCRKNTLGHTVCTDNNGAKITCRTNAIGKTVCK